MNFRVMAFILSIFSSVFWTGDGSSVAAVSFYEVPYLVQNGYKRTLLVSNFYAPGFYWLKHVLTNTPLIKEFTYGLSFSHGLCCGYYAVNAARCIASSNGRDEMLNNAMDEKVFCDTHLPLWALLIKNRRQVNKETTSLTRCVANLNYEEVTFLVNSLPERDHIIVIDSLQMLQELLSGIRKDSVIDAKLKMAKTQHRPIACIMNTSEKSGNLWHWFTMALWPSADNVQNTCIMDVLDSVGYRHGSCSGTAYTQGFFDLYCKA